MRNGNNENKQNKIGSNHIEELIEEEETTKYGEFISSYFAWLGINKQKTRAEELNDMTKRKWTLRNFENVFQSSKKLLTKIKKVL